VKMMIRMPHFRPVEKQMTALKKVNIDLKRSIKKWFRGEVTSIPVFEDMKEETPKTLETLILYVMCDETQNLSLLDWLDLWFALLSENIQKEQRDKLITACWKQAKLDGYGPLLYLMLHQLAQLLQQEVDTTTHGLDIKAGASKTTWQKEQKVQFVEQSRAFLKSLPKAMCKGPGMRLLWALEQEGISRGHNFIEYCFHHPKKPFPYEALRRYGFPTEGVLIEEAELAAKQLIEQERWNHWKYIRWLIESLETTQPKSDWYQFLDTILQTIEDQQLDRSKENFFQYLRKRLGHPLSIESHAWKKFSPLAIERFINWGGSVQFKDYRKFRDILKDSGYFDYLDNIRTETNNYSEKRRLNSRYNFWKDYKLQMKYVRFLLAPQAYEWISDLDDGKERLKESGLGVYLGRRQHKESDVCFIQIGSLFIVQYMYGVGPVNHARFLTEHEFNQNRDKLDKQKVYDSDIMRIPTLRVLSHEPEWQVIFKQFLQEFGIQTDASLAQRK
tara:strand:- start:5019 stop:6521 length:1503 start_codon:yes stop_codon:yes gene_type:complete